MNAFPADSPRLPRAYATPLRKKEEIFTSPVHRSRTRVAGRQSVAFVKDFAHVARHSLVSREREREAARGSPLARCLCCTHVFTYKFAEQPSRSMRTLFVSVVSYPVRVFNMYTRVQGDKKRNPTWMTAGHNGARAFVWSAKILKNSRSMIPRVQEDDRA